MTEVISDVDSKTMTPTLVYQGSVKDVYELGSEELLFHFSDDFSVFDWGKMPDRISGKGRALTLFAAGFFEKMTGASFWQELPNSKHLQQFDREYLQTIFSALEPSETLANHYRGLYSRGKTFKLSAPALADQDQSQELYLQVARARVDRPEVRKIGQSLVYFYDDAARGEGLSFIPLEVVFRFAAPAGSSLLSRLEKDPNYAYVLGLEPDAVKVGALFPHPVIEFFTKLEPSDRLLSYQEAAAIAGLSPAEFERLYQTAHLCALAIFHVFAEQGITLLDGKVEAAVERRLSGKGEMTSRIVLADSIGPDELRLDYKGIQLSKEVLRRYYRNTAWYREIESSKAEAAKRPSVKWQDICRHEKGSAPPPLPPALKECIANMYLALAATMVGGPLAEKICPLSLPAVAEQLAKEIDLAEKEGKP